MLVYFMQHFPVLKDMDNCKIITIYMLTKNKFIYCSACMEVGLCANIYHLVCFRPHGLHNLYYVVC